MVEDATGADSLRDEGTDRQEVGRIALGARHFAVVLAPKLLKRRLTNILCSFDLAGHCLAVIETGERHLPATGETRDDIALRLTGRELEIAALVAQGHANKNIAYRLQISEWTVATYLRRIFLKLDVESRAAMVFRCAPLLKAAANPERSRRRMAGRQTTTQATNSRDRTNPG